MTLSIAPNAAVPAAAYRKRPACDSADAKGHAAGTLLVAPDGHVLLLHRSGAEENFAHHWALPGGGVDDGESPEQGAAREMREEIGHEIEGGKPKLLDQRRTPTGMVFHTFVQPVKQKFAPALNDEHAGFTWAPLDKLPQPIHPAVAATLQDRVGITGDMKPEDWQGMREGFMKWISEEEREPEHMAGDTALLLALDRDTVREYRRDGQMIVKRAHITKANVCPYRGAEIPGFQKLGLDPDRIYQMFRDPEELKKAAPTLNGVQLLFKHIPVNADDHQPHDTVGSLGTDAEFVEEDGENYLDNSLFVNARNAIVGIESKKKHELSAGYHYTPDMTPGNFRGKAYDGVMRDIVFNHVALVEDGRAGPDVVVGDSAENIRMTKPTRLAALALQMTAAAVAPALAMDSKVVLPKDLFTPITSKTFKAQKPIIVEGVRKALNGVKLRPGLAMDATSENVKTVLDALEGVMPEGIDESVSEEQHNAMEAAANGESNIGIPKAVGEEFANADKGKTFDSGQIAEFLKGKGMGEDDIKTVCDMLPKNALAGDAEESEEAKAARLEKEKKEKEGAMDTVSKPAMDAALKAQGDAFEKRLAESQKNEQAIRVAIADVKPWIGDIAATMAFDSAASVHRHALKCLKVQDAETLHPDALMPILRTMPKPGARPVEPAAHSGALAMDSSALATASKYAPDLSGISFG